MKLDFKHIEKALLDYNAKSELKQAAIIMVRNIFKEAETKQCDIPVVSGMLKHRSGVKGVFVKSFYPTGKPLTTVIETDKGYYCAPSNEFVDA
tara:strand:+ start:3110 stop:3388 length:279 start_codon:yes stop_codon:yes gene_type:complete